MQEAARDTIYVLLWGDLIETIRGLASVRRIHEANRRARLILLTTPDYEGLLKHCPWFGAIETDALAEGPAGRLMVKRIKIAKPVAVFDLVGNDTSRRIKGGFRFSRTKWIEAAAKPEPGTHPVEAAAMALGRAGLGAGAYRLGEAAGPDVSWVDYLARTSRTLEPEYFGINGPFALLAPAGDEVKPALRWPKERWASLAHALTEARITPAVVGGPSAREVGRYIAERAPGARDITGKAKLVQLAGLGRRARFVFGEDTGLLHLLVAAGPPALALYPGGEEDPALVAPRGPSTVVIMHAPTLAQVTPEEAMQAMRFAGGFDETTRAA
ncbi:lipopolysaccharide heptosyltransferase family protein [Hyphobacterium sp. SN044]|uniref:glycosyltransferase family 9 protein n=1 Tax=Hyphobacterium sp. SN044 TaxID=2912575 RepID=UPI001F18F486|nr:glycosyltransferase family 9 protein [Hyphobacterium sp. SN044]MCF8880381.1 lipopolysaccharide heptosyltransferase family protein [Hyphobacterium sp. SN044]